jgi:hypothetical protein
VPIHRLLENQGFEPEQIRAMATAFDETLRALKLVDRTDPLTDIVATKVIEVAQTGERDPQRIRDRVLQALVTR